MIAGVQVTPATIQRIRAIAHSLGLSENDAMLPILIMLDTYHGTFSSAPTAVVEAIKKASKDVSGTIDAAAKKSVGQAVVDARQDINAAAVAAFGGLAEEAKQVVIKAGKDIAAIDADNAKAQVIQEQTALLRNYAVVGVGLFLASLLAGAGIMYGATSATLYSAKQDVQAALERAAAAESGAAAAVTAAVSDATKKFNSEFAMLKSGNSWSASAEGVKVINCKMPTWRIAEYTDGTRQCITNPAVKNIIGDDTKAVGFWMQKAK